MNNGDLISRQSVLNACEQSINILEAVDRIMDLPSVEQEPCEDAISRDAVLEKAVYTETEEGWCGYTVDVDYIKSLPPVKQEPKTGHWIKQTLSVKPFGEDTVLCDQCAFMTDKDNTYNYCPNCGAKMQESED